MRSAEGWREQRACRGMDTNLFFPDREADEHRAKAVCYRCPVRDECLEAGMKEPDGIWGGLNPRQRTSLYRRRLVVARRRRAS